MKMAQEQAAKMTPEQRAAMQEQSQKMAQQNPEMFQKMAQQFGGISPEQMQQAQAQMNNMSSDDFAKATEQMASMTPEQMQEQMKQQSSVSNAQEEYKYKASVQLKTDGNTQHGLGNYAAASEKYKRAKDNLEFNYKAEAKQVRKACMLNLASCYLKLHKLPECIQECTEVLATDKNNMKAFYRRGLARKEKGDVAEAVQDLRTALKLSDKDETIEAHVKESEAKLKELGLEDPGEAPPEPEPAPVAPPTGMPDSKEMLQKMKDNPEMLSNMSDMMSNMSPEQLEAMSAAAPGGAGMPKLTPEMAKQAGEMMKNMTPEAMESMMKMAENMKGAMGPGGGDPANMSTEEQMKVMQEQMNNPETMEAMSDMMKNISPEMMEKMSKSMGMNMTSEQAQKTAEMMKNIKPEDMQKLMKMAGYAQRAMGMAMRVKTWMMGHKLVVVAVGGPLLAMFVMRLMRWWSGGSVDVDAINAATGAGVGLGGEDEEEDLFKVEAEF
eukprot:CAMPEP_0197852586 /NCGR_PEP_ID=MMETSP1438-20131217/20976_1 /TAXON_ID=1461541 /ORGANISM="Pterosperma sp., Strain CCMP1384" /LENGTH=494 /DNA_ID=CAMNT_0043466707 /DNA_START=273 /DNA_END=1757 /DNA_ORIENTATION=+